MSRSRRKMRPQRRALDPRLAALGIFLLALLVRIIYVLQARANPQFAAPLMDAGYHDEWAWQLASGTWRSEGPFFRAPLYPLFLAGLYKMAGHNYLVPRLVQAAIGSLNCVLIYLIGSRLFSRGAGLAAGVGGALYGILIYFDNELLIPTFFTALVLAFFYSLIRTLTGSFLSGERDRHLALWAAGAGAFFGLAAITRPSVLAFVPPLMWGLWFAARRGLPWRAVGILALVALIPIAAVTAYNTIAGDDFVPIASQGGVNFYIGNNPESDGRTAIVPGTRGDWWGGRFDTIRIAEDAAGRSLKDSEVSDYWLRRAFEFIGAEPFAWLKLTARKFGLFWTAAEQGNNSSIRHLQSYAAINRLPFFGFGLIAPLAIGGMFLAWRRRRREALLPALFILFYMAGVVAFFVCARFRVPVIPFLLIFAGYMMVAGGRLWRSGEKKVLVPALIALHIVVFAINIPAHGYRENLAQARFHDGIAWKKQGNLVEAERALRDALRRDPSLAVARNNLANLLAERGDASSAREAYEAALAADPNNAKTLANLAALHLEAGELDLAMQRVARALSSDPTFSEALRVKGVILEEKGELAGARESYTRALEFTREQHRLENNLGVVAMKEDQVGLAERHLRRAIALDPQYVRAWNNLGALLVNAARLSEAVAVFERVAELEPTSQHSWLQLAEVYRLTGREADAQRARARAAGARGR